MYRLKLSTNSKEELIDAIKALRKRPDIISADPSFYLQDMSVGITDPYYTQGNQWAIEKIDLLDAWNITTGSSEVKVGIFDRGIDVNHEDLINGNIAQSGHRKYYLDSKVWGMDSLPQDNSGHGTRIAGIIGASSNNGKGIVGVCHNVSLISFKYDLYSNTRLSEVLYGAIDYANSNYIPIINVSGGWYKNDPIYIEQDNDILPTNPLYQNSLKQMIDSYYGLVVCAAGNNGTDNDGNNPVYPASYSCENIISVGASDESDNMPVWVDNTSSNYGETKVDLFAPGNNIYAPNIDWDGSHSEYILDSGTSYAAPYVAGVAALLLSKYPCLSTSEIKDAILDNVDEIGALDGKCVTGGRLNAYEALRNCQPKHDAVLQWEVTSTSHAGECICGEVFEPHEYAYSNVTATTHKQTCAVCGYNTVVPHLWRVISKTTTGHVKQCNCGHTVDEVHTWVQNALGGYICSVCRQTGNFTPGIQSLLTPAGRLTLQAANLQHGQVALIEGLPIIYFNGEYYLLSDSTTQVPYPIPPALQTE